MIHIVKSRGHKESFDQRKVYATAYAACLNVHLSSNESEKIASKVSNDINEWIKNKNTVTSQEIFEKVAESLRKYNDDAAFMYATHRDVS